MAKLPKGMGKPLDWSGEEAQAAVSAIGPAEIKQLDAYAALGNPLLRAMYGAAEYQPPDSQQEV